ncbi:MAG: [Fe-Fe] hydrogenase large subunit C-terminal domain-containing protein [Anaerobutyricum soehngenii]
MVDCLSTAKSPQQMRGAIIKNTTFADKIHEDPENIFSVSIMPCIAKKAEPCTSYNGQHRNRSPDVDVAMNTREFVDYTKPPSTSMFTAFQKTTLTLLAEKELVLP